MNQSVQVGVAMLPQLLPADWCDPASIAIVIDTLRFTSTACVALAAGARCIRVLSDIQMARQLACTSEPRMLLCGERHCVKISGFDLGNSPSEYVASVVNDKDLVFSTTNGTFAVEAVKAAPTVALGSLLNRQAVTEWIAARSTERVWIVCAGTDGQIAQEDVLTAGAILDLQCTNARVVCLNDSAQIALNSWRHALRENNLAEQLKMARGGRNLIESGFSSDVAAVAQIDQLICVPVMETSQALSSVIEFRDVSRPRR